MSAGERPAVGDYRVVSAHLHVRVESVSDSHEHGTVLQISETDPMSGRHRVRTVSVADWLRLVMPPCTMS